MWGAVSVLELGALPDTGLGLGEPDNGTDVAKLGLGDQMSMIEPSDDWDNRSWVGANSNMPSDWTCMVAASTIKGCLTTSPDRSLGHRSLGDLVRFCFFTCRSAFSSVEAERFLGNFVSAEATCRPKANEPQ